MLDPTIANLQKEIIALKICVNNLEKAESFFEKISVVNDALTAFKTGGVSAMYDPTEGGVAGGLHELADAAKLGLLFMRNLFWFRGRPLYLTSMIMSSILF